MVYAQDILSKLIICPTFFLLDEVLMWEGGLYQLGVVLSCYRCPPRVTIYYLYCTCGVSIEGHKCWIIYIYAYIVLTPFLFCFFFNIPLVLFPLHPMSFFSWQSIAITYLFPWPISTWCALKQRLPNMMHSNF